MDKYILSCCSTADLTEEHFKNIGVSYVSFTFEMDGKQYIDDLGKSIPFDEFYKKVGDGANVKTSQVNEKQFEEYFESFLEKGYDILHLCLSSGISGVMNSANMAKNLLAEKYPDRKILLVDSLAASSGYGLLVDLLAEKKNQGMGIDELYEFAEQIKLNIHHWFFTTDLTCFIRGGRVSKTAGFVGKLLSICPLLNVDYKGQLQPREKIRGKKNAIERAAEMMLQHAKDGENYTGKCFISHSACEDDAKELASKIQETFQKMQNKVEIDTIGTVIGCHTGPGTVALFFVGDERKD